MGRPTKLLGSDVDAWLLVHPGWERDADGNKAIARTYRFPDFDAALAFAVRLGRIAKIRDHHPEVHLGWGRARVVWTTHDASGITSLDLSLAEATDEVSA